MHFGLQHDGNAPMTYKEKKDLKEQIILGGSVVTVTWFHVIYLERYSQLIWMKHSLSVNTNYVDINLQFWLLPLPR